MQLDSILLETHSKHGSKITGAVAYDYCPHCGGKCEFENGKPRPPSKVSSSDIKDARRALVDSAYYLLTRCYRMGLLNDDELKQKCDLIGTSIDPNDLTG